MQLHGGFFMQIRFCHLWQRAALVSTLRANDVHPYDIPFLRGTFLKNEPQDILNQSNIHIRQKYSSNVFLCSQNVHRKVV